VRGLIPQGHPGTRFTVSALLREAGGVSCFNVSGVGAAGVWDSAFTVFSIFTRFTVFSVSAVSAAWRGSAGRVRRARGLARISVLTIMRQLRYA